MSWFSERRREVEPFASDDDPRDFDGEADERRWAAIGRFAHVAEAGYFAEELMHELDAPVRVRAEPTFDGMHHYWRTRYVLLAPEMLREKAMELLAELVALTGSNEPPLDAADVGDDEEMPANPVETARVREQPPERRSGRSAAFDQPPSHERFDPEDAESGIHWAPIMLTLTAGSAVFFGLRLWMDGAPHPGRAPAHGGTAELWDAMSGSSSNWTQTLPDGRGHRSVRFSPQRDTAVLEEDVDGDGRVERRVVIRRGE